MPLHMLLQVRCKSYLKEKGLQMKSSQQQAAVNPAKQFVHQFLKSEDTARVKIVPTAVIQVSKGLLSSVIALHACSDLAFESRFNIVCASHAYQPLLLYCTTVW